MAAGFAFVVLRLERSKRIATVMLRLQDSNAQICVRGAFMLLVAFVALASLLGLETILGAFIAGCDRADGPASRSPMGELLDSLDPVSPCLSKKAGNGLVLSFLHRPDFDMAHAFATAYQQPPWIRQEAPVEEAEIHMCLKDREVYNWVA